jgi:hypothetical protein
MNSRLEYSEPYDVPFIMALKSFVTDINKK